MLTPPDDLPEQILREAFALESSLEYRPVGWGSHHWAAGTAWFLTVDDLEVKRRHDGEDLDAPYERLRGALDAASALSLPFVVAPVRPLMRVTRRYAAALYPYLEGESFSWGDFPAESHRDAVRDMLVALHTAPREIGRRATTDDFVIPHRDALEATLAGYEVADAGPYTARAVSLIARHTTPVRALLERYDVLAATADRSRSVLTHGEPHPGNTMLTAEGFKLIDWETALLAPPERDLWLLGDDHSAYTAATGIEVLPDLLELYRRRWMINDLCVDVNRFRHPHTGTADDEESWNVLQANVLHL
ncbi:aminoglycoside phosphotransferase family protein [Actinoplanes sp. NPDC051346]|uniref:aminoglycoside phosphotransferase family protein n=1 Tax=Actinoplanes sp. NPDC051346 TaxID=3155048 RepID=UPI00342C1507